MLWVNVKVNIDINVHTDVNGIDVNIIIDADIDVDVNEGAALKPAERSCKCPRQDPAVTRAKLLH